MNDFNTSGNFCDLQIGNAGGDFIIDKLNGSGYSAYYVGGCVRNTVLGIKIKDYDITTSARPEEVKKVFSDYKFVGNGIKHGTVTVIVNNAAYEITTFRTEGKYSDSRHPDKVYFCNKLADDLKRRDFTCNAMAFCKNQGIIDYFGGYYDTRNLILKAVGVPTSRFKEDALRILRGLRLSSEYGFIAEDKTARAMKSNAKLLDNISRERVYSEIKRIFSGKRLYDALCDYRDIAEISLKTNIDEKLYSSALKKAAECEGDFYLRFSIFLYAINKSKSDSLKIADKMRSENRLRNLIAKLFDCIDCFYTMTDNCADNRYIAKNILMKVGDDYDYFKKFVLSVVIGKYKDLVTDLIMQCEDVLEKNECYKITMLAVKGSDLEIFGFSGKEIGAELNKILDLIMQGKLNNTASDITEYIKKNG